jgi:hypothetical protein
MCERHQCPVDQKYYEIEPLMTKLFHDERLSRGDGKQLRALIQHYMKVECDSWPAHCPPATCPFARPGEAWVSYLGYTSMNDVLRSYELSAKIEPPTRRRGFDAMKATWAQLPGSMKG